MREVTEMIWYYLKYHCWTSIHLHCFDEGVERPARPLPIMLIFKTQCFIQSIMSKQGNCLITYQRLHAQQHVA
jgi:hypothetical protein